VLTAREIRAGKKPTRTLGAYSWWTEKRAHLSGILQAEQRFRKQTREEIDLVLLPDNAEAEDFELWRFPNSKDHQNVCVERSLNHRIDLIVGDRMQTWINDDYITSLRELATQTNMELRDCAYRYGTLTLPAERDGWRFHSHLGFSTHSDEMSL
jgi:CRISPR-associated endonuclease/helicase Cas3